MAGKRKSKKTKGFPCPVDIVSGLMMQLSPDNQSRVEGMVKKFIKLCPHPELSDADKPRRPAADVALDLVSLLKDRNATKASAAVLEVDLARSLGITNYALANIATSLRSPLFAVIPLRTDRNPAVHGYWLAQSSNAVNEAVRSLEGIIDYLKSDLAELRELCADMEDGLTSANNAMEDRAANEIDADEATEAA